MKENGKNMVLLLRYLECQNGRHDLECQNAGILPQGLPLARLSESRRGEK